MKKIIVLFLLIAHISVNAQNHYVDYLNINQVNALYQTDALFFFQKDIHNWLYEVPKLSGKNSLLSSSVWIAGLDELDSLHCAAMLYGNGNEFFPGPLDTVTASTDSLKVDQYNYIWKIYKCDVDKHIDWFTNNPGTPYTIPNDFLSWPASDTGNYSRKLAPFVDVNNNGIYEPQLGDYPDIKGNQALYWIINDAYKPHTESEGEALGIELHCMAYAYKHIDPSNTREDIVNYQTFLQIEVINRSPNNYHDVYFGLNTHALLGDSYDNRIGCDVDRNSYYFYNGSDSDAVYGSNPPLQTVTLLQGPLADINDGIDNNRNGITDEVGERIAMSYFKHYVLTGGSAIWGYPHVDVEFYAYLKGLWRDNTSMYYYGNGHLYTGGDTTLPCKYMFPDDSDPNYWGTNGIAVNPWTEITAGNQPYDRYGVMSIGPFSLATGDKKSFNFLYGFFHDTLSIGAAAVNSPVYITDFHNELDSIKMWFDNNSFPQADSCAIYLGVEEDNEKHFPLLYPNPVKDYFYIENALGYDYAIFDICGKCLSRALIREQNQKIDATHLSRGMYFISFYKQKQLISTRKFIKQ